MKHGGRLDLCPAQGISDRLLIQSCCFKIHHLTKLLWTFSSKITSQPRYGIVAASLDGVIHASGGNVGADTGDWRHFRQKYLLYSYLTAICLFLISFGQIKFRQTFCITGPETHAIHISLSNLIHLYTPRSIDMSSIQYKCIIHRRHLVLGCCIRDVDEGILFLYIQITL